MKRRTKGLVMVVMGASLLSICCLKGPEDPMYSMGSIAVTSPAAGDDWAIGSTETIQWSSSGTSGLVTIRVTYEGGGYWSTIASSISDDGNHAWIVEGSASTNCMIWVADVEGSPSDRSGTFTISSEPVSPHLDMVSLSGGSFQMGSNSSWAQSDEQPVHQVTISAISMAQYEVTNEEVREVLQWAYDNGRLNAGNGTVTNAEGSAQELLDLDDDDCEIDFSNGTFTVESEREDHPCIEVTWYGAQAFCNYLSDMEGLDRCISFSGWSCTWGSDGYRLPTEAEWEYACRAGTTTDYYSGDETGSGCDYDPVLNMIAWYCFNASRTETVSRKQASDWGFCDMSGNVWEWCWDWWGWYSSEAQTDPTGPTHGSDKLIRGGSWSGDAEYCRSANRNYGALDGSGNSLGFRPARR